MIFRLGKQKLVKNNQGNQIQSITLCNMYSSKNVHAVYNGVWGKVLQSVRLLLTVSCRKNWGSRIY